MPGTWEADRKYVLDALARNEASHQSIDSRLGEVQAGVSAIEVDVAHLAGRRNGRGWWRPVVLSAGLAIAAGMGSWGAITLIGHGSRLAVLEKPAAVPPAPTVPQAAGHGAKR